jgi:hypothetical protein
LASQSDGWTLISAIGTTPETTSTTPRVLGVDDLALRRGYIYGTVQIDILTRQPVDALPNRNAES